MPRHAEIAGPHRPSLRRTGRLLCLLAVACSLCACGEKPVAKVSTESDAVEIVNRLTEHGLTAEKGEVGEGETVRWSVSVDEGWFGSDETARATQVLNYYGLPRPEEQSAGADASGGLFPTPAAESAKQLREYEKKIEKQLRVMPGVARVEASIVLPEDDDIKINPYKASASVVIRLKEENARFNAEQVRGIIVNSVPDLQPERVGVAMIYEPPPAIARPDLNLQRRNRIILYVGLVLVIVLCVLLVILLLRVRRQRAELALLRDGEELGLEEGEEEATAAAQLTGGEAEPARPGVEPPDANTNPRQLTTG